MSKRVETIGSLIADINDRLNGLEESMMWTIKATDRFKPGQRVEFSPMADRNGLSLRRKGGVRTGVVEQVDSSFTIMVRLDGYTKPISFHHKFFQPSSKRKPAKGGT